MKRALFLVLAGLALASVVGCASTGDVTTSGANQVKDEMSKENFEKAMKEQGKGDILEQEKAQSQQRGGDNF